MTIRKTGFSAALPFLLAIVMKMIAGPLSDALTLLSDKMRVVLFTSVSQVCVFVCKFEFPNVKGLLIIPLINNNFNNFLF